MPLLRRLQQIDERLRFPNSQAVRHITRWWRWYCAGTVSLLLLGVLLLFAGRTAVGLAVLVMTASPAFSAFLGWRLASRDTPQ